MAMNCIVTAGPTFEKLDQVRRLTNFSTGRLGTELANYLTDQGHTVTYAKYYDATGLHVIGDEMNCIKPVELKPLP